jgi:putative hydrolase of the HAD superfamily
MFALQVELRHNPTWPMPGADDVLLHLHRAGYTQGIISNAQFFTPLILQQQLGLGLGELGISAPMRIWSYEHGVAKPEPALFQRMVSGLDAAGISSAQALYVGNDMLNDIAGAQGAGMQTALFAGDSRSYRPRAGDQRVRDIRPDAVLLSLISLLELLP